MLQLALFASSIQNIVSSRQAPATFVYDLVYFGRDGVSTQNKIPDTQI